MKGFIISTEAISFDPDRFRREFILATKGKKLKKFDFKENPKGFDYLLNFTYE